MCPHKQSLSSFCITCCTERVTKPPHSERHKLNLGFNCPVLMVQQSLEYGRMKVAVAVPELCLGFLCEVTLHPSPCCLSRWSHSSCMNPKQSLDQQVLSFGCPVLTSVREGWMRRVPLCSAVLSYLFPLCRSCWHLSFLLH